MKAIFLGKFQPPHLGHIRTIQKLAKEFDKLIVGITKSKPFLIEYEEIKQILNEILELYTNIEIVLIDGSIEEETANISSLEFDIVVSGIHKVLDILSNKGYKTKFKERTEGIGYSGSEIRTLSHIVTKEAIDKTHQDNKVKLVLLSELKPLEKILPSHYKNIESMILNDGYIKKPLIIDNKYKIVLDGSHRYAFLLKFGFKYAPVIMVNYNDESIFVGNHLKHRYIKDKLFTISKKEVVSRALSEDLFNARTTRHFFPFRKIDYKISLKKLKQGKERDLSFLIQDITIKEEIDIDRQYIKEINEEIDVLKEYKKEQVEVKKYLKEQIKFMKKENS